MSNVTTSTLRTGFLAFLLAFALALGGAENAPAQSSDGPTWRFPVQGGFSYSRALPTGGFDDTFGRMGQGGVVSLGVKAASINTIPLYIGVDLAAYGYKTRDISAVIDGIGGAGAYQIRNYLYQPHVSVRLEEETGAFNLFVEGLAGTSIFETRFKGFTGPAGNQTNVSSASPDRSIVFSGGGGVGLDVELYKVTFFDRYGRFGINGSLHYIYGNDVDIPVETTDNSDGGGGAPDLSLSGPSEHISTLRPKFGLYFEVR